MYLLMFISQKKQFQDIVKVNEIVSAKFLISEKYPNGILMDIIIFVKVYRPCGKLNLKAKCMTLDLITNCKKCCKRFLKFF